MVKILLAFLVLTGSAEAADQTRLYDKHGVYTGSIHHEQDRDSFYNRHGQYDGKSVNRGNQTDFYDSHGVYQGSERR